MGGRLGVEELEESGSASGRRLRQDARACLDAAVAAVDPTRLVADMLEQHPDAVPSTDPIHVVAVGKAATAMARAVCEIFGPRVAGGVVIAPTDTEMGTLGNLRTFRGGHPVPTDGSEQGARAVAQLVDQLGADDFLLCLISGGGSALMTLPPSGVPLGDVRETTETLLRAGATIDELNCVRKHLDRLKGGRMAHMAAPAKVLALILSDVLGDPPDVIASGPLSPDPTTFSDALAIVDRRQVRDRIPISALEYLESGTRGEVPETPGPDAPFFHAVEVRIVGNNRMAADAAVQEAERRGYTARLLSTSLRGDANEVGRMLAVRGLQIKSGRGSIAPPACLIASGETTVDVRGAGRGGRNQELVLGGALALHGQGPLLMASMGTDGIDGASHAAGAFADQTTIARAEALGLDAEAALAANDSTPFFEALGDLIVTGPTGTNVMDIQVVLIPE
jgi:hydroxypyruvate reductase